MTTTRTDVHRPSADEFDPADYVFRGAYDLDPKDGSLPFRAAKVRSLRAQGYRFAGVHPTGQCDHCGTHIRYEGLLTHTPTRTIVTVGEQCLDNRFAGSADEFKALRKAAAAKAAATREANRRNATKDAAAEYLSTHNALLVELSYRGNGGTADNSGFLTDLAYSLYKFGALTDRQAVAAVKAISREIEWATRRDIRRAEEAARQATVAPAPTGRVAVKGAINRTWTRDSGFGTQFKMRVTADDGYIVISTIPAAVLDAFGAEHPTKNHYAMTELLAGRRVEFTATLTPTDGDPTAAWANRPSKARLVTA